MRRLELQLPERLGLLHLLGVVDVLALLLAFLIVGALNGGEVGAKIKLMEVGEVMAPESGVIVVTARGTSAYTVVSIGKNTVPLEEVATLLKMRKKETGFQKVYLSIQKDLPLTIQETLLIAINEAQLDCTIIGEKRKVMRDE